MKMFRCFVPLCLSLSTIQGAPSTFSPEPAEPSPVSAEERLEQVDQLILRTISVLETVKDKESADAAAAPLARLLYLSERHKSQGSMPVAELSPEKLQAYAGHLNRMSGLIAQIAQNDFYDSVALLESFNAMLQTASAPPSEESTLPELSPEELDRMANEIISIGKDLIALLEPVKDKESADAAAPAIRALIPRLEKIAKIGESHSIPDPSDEQMEEILILRSDVRGAMERLESRGCFGSDALKSALERLQ